MPSAKIILDKRRTNADGTQTIFIVVHIFNQKQSFSSGFHCLPANFSPTGGKNGISWVTAGAARHLINAKLRDMLARAQDCVIALTNNRPPSSQLRSVLAAAIKGEQHASHTIIATMENFANIKKGRTRELYLTTVKKLRKYIPNDISFEDTTKAWLEHFQAAELSYTSQNAISIHLRNIRAVFNFAIDNELTSAYPFRRFKIRHEETPHRALSTQQLQRLATISCEPYQVIYRDFFFLSFFLIGINPIDLLHLTASDIHNGRLEYRRSKTHKPYSVKLEPEALALIKRYTGKRFLLSPLDRNADYHNWLRRCNDALKKIGDLQRVGRGGKKIHSPIEPQLTMYWARHTWATIAAALDIPKETIAAALGHEIGNAVTSIYIRFDQRKVDLANRRVIDFFLSLF